MNQLYTVIELSWIMTLQQNFKVCIINSVTISNFIQFLLYKALDLTWGRLTIFVLYLYFANTDPTRPEPGLWYKSICVILCWSLKTDGVEMLLDCMDWKLHFFSFFIVVFFLMFLCILYRDGKLHPLVILKKRGQNYVCLTCRYELSQ